MNFMVIPLRGEIVWSYVRWAGVQLNGSTVVYLPPCALALGGLGRAFVFWPGHSAVESSYHPALKTEQVLPATAKNHRIWFNSTIDHLAKAIPDALPCLLLVAAYKHVGHQAGRGNSCTIELLYPIEK